ncbi:Metal tolerance protein C4 [Vitis vinifera]|uniref:Metal tolerance protein C4 n=1 Tax=Vitis vinifera TaxID=29760 RepID=A0A438BSJ8_VITVI|nr:Metal tolerance protein C4 [Vitis vinifera]
MQRSINKKIGSCLLRFTPSPSPALLTRHHYSHFPLSRLLTLSQFLHSSPSFNHNLQQPSSYCKFPENGALFFAPRPILRNFLCSCGTSLDSNRHCINRSEYFFFFEDFFTRAKEVKNIEINDQQFGVWLTTSSHVMLAEVVHSAADFANQPLLAYGLSSSRRAPDAIHP